MLGSLIPDLRTEGGVAALGRKCPTLVQTQWVDAVDALNAVLRRRGAINVFRDGPGQPPIFDSLAVLYRIFLPLKLTSLRVKARDCKLHNLMPITLEDVRQLRTIRGLLHDHEDLAILGTVTICFFGRLETNTFSAIVIAWILPIDDRGWPRVEE
jgi:hypothetical protein